MPHKGFGSRWDHSVRSFFVRSSHIVKFFCKKIHGTYSKNANFKCKNILNFDEYLDSDSVCDQIKSRLNTDLITCFWFWFCDSNCITVSCCFWERSQGREMECCFRNDSKTIRVSKKTFHLSDVLLRVYGWYGNWSEEFCISYTVKRNALIFGMKMGYWKQKFFPALGPVTESRLHLTQIRIYQPNRFR